MNARRSIGICLGLGAIILGGAPTASAQNPGPSGSTTGLTPQQPLAVQLYGNAATNPYLNPYMMGSQGNGDFLLYMYARNQQAGGIGSGVISGTRPAPGAPAGSARSGAKAAASVSPTGERGKPGSMPAPSRETALIPNSVMSPISNTGGYFQRGPGGSTGSGQYYNRTQPARPRNNAR